MSNFFDINYDEKRTIEEYLDLLDNQYEKAIVSHMFKDARRVLALHKKLSGTNCGIPEIRIILKDELIAEGIEGYIEISVGIIKYCLKLRTMDLLQLVKINSRDLILYDRFVSCSFFSWLIAHEYIHTVNFHDRALQNLNETEGFVKATEIDADLCGIAMLYRFLQTTLSSYLDDITIRQITFCCVYLGLRGLPRYKSSNSHPDTFDRIYYMYGKMVMLRKNLSDPPDPDCTTNECRNNARPILNQLVRCEKYYHQSKSSAQSEEDLINYIFTDFFKNGKHREFTLPWEELSEVISNIILELRK